MVEHLDAEQLLERGLDLLNARVAKLDDFTGVGEDDVVVLLDAVAFLVLGHFFAKLVLADQIAIDEQVHRVVQRGAAHAVFALGHVRVERFDVEVAVVRINLLQDRKALRRLSVAVLFEVGLEEVADLVGDGRCGRWYWTPCSCSCQGSD